MVLKLGLSLSERSRALGCSRMKYLERHLGLREMKLLENGESLHIAKLHAWYSSPNIIRNFKSRLLRWAGHVARME